MFGFLFYIWMGIVKLFSDIYDICKDISCRKKTNNGLTYMDGNMCLRSSQTNAPVFWDNETGQLRDSKGNVYADRNWDRIIKRSKERKQEAIEKGRSTFELLNSIEAKTYDPKHKDVVGARYLDLLTNEVYVVRSFLCGEKWYVNLNNGKLVRKTDYELDIEKTLPADKKIKRQNKTNEIIERYKDIGYLQLQNRAILDGTDVY